MDKRTSILFAAILILAAGVALAIGRAGLPLPTLLKDRSAHGMGSSPVVPVSTTTPLATSVATSTPFEDLPGSAPTPLSISISPICFTTDQLPVLAFSADNSKILVRASAGVQVFDLQTGSLEAYIKAAQAVIIAALSPDGQTIAWSLQDGTLQLVNRSSQEVLANLIGHPDPVYHLQFSPTGDKLVSASHDSMARVWDLKGNLLATIVSGSSVVGLGISPDGSKLATIPSDGPVSIWDLAGYTKIVDLGGTGGYDTSDASFSPDGQFMAADLATGLYMWRLSDASLVWHQVSNSMAVEFSPDGQYLAYSDIDDGNKVFLASADATQTIRVVDELQSPVWALLFSPDSSLLSVTDGVEIRVWRVEDGSSLATGKTTCP